MNAAFFSPLDLFLTTKLNGIKGQYRIVGHVWVEYTLVRDEGSICAEILAPSLPTPEKK